MSVKTLKISLLFCLMIVLGCVDNVSNKKEKEIIPKEEKIKASETKLLVISGHPNLEKSTANQIILSDLESHFRQKISVRRLDVLYADYKIDVLSEQQSLLNADVIVFQFPFYWYGTPALLKKWIDDVLIDFFDGRLKDKFKGKKVIISLTTGAPQEVYTAPNPAIDTYLFPLKETFEVLGGEWLPLVCSFNYIPENKDVEKQAHSHAQELIQLIEKTME